MRIVKRFKTRKNILTLRALNDDEVKALFWVFVENKGKVQQKQLACAIAEFIKYREGWPECDCHPESSPLMTIGLSVKSNYYLRRINWRGKHHQQCQFKGIDREYGAQSGEIKPCSKRVLLRLHHRGAIESPVSKKTGSYGGGSSGIYYPRLARVLYSWIEEAGLNKLSVLGNETIADRFKLLRKVAESYQLERGIKASRFLMTYPDVEQAAARLKENASQWPENSRPYALCIAIADKIEGKILRFAFKKKSVEVTLTGEIKQSSGRIGENSGPFLVIFTITDTAEERGVYKPMNAFYVPVYSKFQLIPVDNVFECRVLEKIEQRARWWIKGNALKVRVSKPLFNIKKFCDGELQASKPDFLIETPNGMIIFEVMGSHEQDYIERKGRTVGCMRALGEVIEFDALNADKTGYWDESLKQHISRLRALVFRGNGK